MRKKALALFIGLALVLLALPAAAAPAWSAGQTTLTFLGHAAFALESGQTAILIDAYLTGNPQAAARPILTPLRGPGRVVHRTLRLA